jgi:hypothetical protein
VVGITWPVPDGMHEAELERRDKAKVEVGVLIIERYVLARLRKTRLLLVG